MNLITLNGNTGDASSFIPIDYGMNQVDVARGFQTGESIPDSLRLLPAGLKPSPLTSKTNTPVSAEPLPSDQSRDFQACEAVIAKEWKSFVKISREATAAVRSQFASTTANPCSVSREDYYRLSKRWDFSRPHNPELPTASMAIPLMRSSCSPV